jgi:hypothetical protein
LQGRAVCRKSAGNCAVHRAADGYKQGEKQFLLQWADSHRRDISYLVVSQQYT